MVAVAEEETDMNSPEQLLAIVGVCFGVIGLFVAFRAAIAARSARKTADDAMRITKSVVERFIPVEQWVYAAEQVRKHAVSEQQRRASERETEPAE